MHSVKHVAGAEAAERWLKGAMRCGRHASLNKMHYAPSPVATLWRSIASVASARPDAVLTPGASAAAVAHSAGSLAFGFSAGGLLFPYYIGNISALQEMRIIGPGTKLGGASAGSLIAACCQSGMSMEALTQGCLSLCDDCRSNGTRFRLGQLLEGFLQELLPDDVHERCSGNTFVAVTQTYPKLRSELVSQFRSRQDLIDTLLTSCHVPWWFDGSFLRRYQGLEGGEVGLYCDGGFTNFIPSPPAEHCVNVSAHIRTLAHPE